MKTIVEIVGGPCDGWQTERPCHEDRLRITLLDRSRKPTAFHRYTLPIEETSGKRIARWKDEP